MNSLTMPELNLFNSRRSPHSYHHPYIAISDTTLDLQKQYITKNIHLPSRDFDIVTNVRGLSVQSKYKQMAEDYLQKRTRIPSYYIEPSPYSYEIPSYLSQVSASRIKSYPCSCEYQLPQRDFGDKKITSNPYVGLRQEVYERKQPRIQKQPYIQPTFRDRRAFINQERTVNIKQQKTNENKNAKHQTKHSASTFNVEFGQTDNSQIINKLKTNQSDEVGQSSKVIPIQNIGNQNNQSKIQTQLNVKNKSMGINTSKIQQNLESSTRVQRILHEQKLLIESLRVELQRQNDFKFDLEDLQSTKKEYVDRSRQLLFKLNELADDKQQFGLVLKSLPDKMKTNVFGCLDF